MKPRSHAIKKNPAKKLLVEGANDTLFFSACWRMTQPKDGTREEIWIGPPTAIDPDAGDGKGNAIKLLPDLLKGMTDGRVTHLAMVVDADQKSSGGDGFRETWEKIGAILKPAGYRIPDKPGKPEAGFHFKHKDGLPDFGLWIMPNNCDDGMLEHFIKGAVIPAELDLLNHASKVVSALPHPKFRPHHSTKAEVASWLAWQTTPGQGLQSSVGNKLLNFETGLAKHYIHWLKIAFT